MEGSNEKLWERIETMGVAIAELKAKQDQHAPREWVRDLVRPIEQAVTRMEIAVNDLAEESKKLYASHDALLKQKAEGDLADLRSKTPLGLVKKWGPVVTLLLGLATLYALITAAVQGWLRAHGVA